MSVIAVKGVPPMWSLMNTVKVLAKSISGNFEALNFEPVKAKAKSKICYLRLSEKLDPVRVVEKINSTIYPKQFRPFAYIPDYVPDIPLATKPKRLPFKMRRALKLPEENAPEQVVVLTNAEILTELQSKYPGLYSVSKKTNHKLLEELARKILERLKVIGEQNTEVMESCFKLSQWYRRTHPHFGDFQLVLSTLHALEDAAGTPRTQIEEKELAVLPSNTCTETKEEGAYSPRLPGGLAIAVCGVEFYRECCCPFSAIDKLPFNKVQAACNKYTDRIVTKISAHVKGLKSEVLPTDTEDEVVRKKVREELKKMQPFLPLIVRQVITKHFTPRKAGGNYQRVRIYGEPFLPSKDTMVPFVRRYQPVRVSRSERMFNCLRFNVPLAHYASLVAMDGTVLNGAKLIIRSSDLPQYKVSQAALGGNASAEPQRDEDVDMDAEDWNEEL